MSKGNRRNLDRVPARSLESGGRFHQRAHRQAIHAMRHVDQNADRHAPGKTNSDQRGARTESRIEHALHRLLNLARIVASRGRLSQREPPFVENGHVTAVQSGDTGGYESADARDGIARKTNPGPHFKPNARRCRVRRLVGKDTGLPRGDDNAGVLNTV